jgi:hypothetical protein
MPKLLRDIAFELGQTVYLKVRNERLAGMVVDILVDPGGVMYGVTWSGGEHSRHYAMELTDAFEQQWGEDGQSD